MSSHFRWYPSSPEVVPWTARYPYPTAANKCVKTTPRIPPKNGQSFKPNTVIRCEFPAQGYVNPANTYVEFDVVLTGFPTVAASNAADLFLVNNVQSIFSRVRILYGSNTLEDIPGYNIVVRALTEWTSSSQKDFNQTSINEGIGGTADSLNVRKTYIQGLDYSGATVAAAPNGGGIAPVAYMTCTRRYCIQLACGLFNQEKLIPTKWMASQFAIESTVAQLRECTIYNTVGITTTGEPSFSIENVNLVPEILDFEPSYDATFLMGLQNGGVPIKYSSWHRYQFACTGSVQNLQIAERAKSIKAIFAVMRRAVPLANTDNGALLTSTTTNSTATTLNSFQFRIGGRYFPAAPVQCSAVNGTGALTPQGAEAYMELAKALNIVGDYRLSTFVNPFTFGSVSAPDGGGIYPQEGDHQFSFTKYDMNGVLVASANYGATTITKPIPSANFAMAASLETSNGFEVSGLNGEEQSDISLIANYSGGQDKDNFQYEVYVLYDAMLILKENNTMELIA